MYQIPFLVSFMRFLRSKFSAKSSSKAGKKGELSMFIQIVIWIAVVMLVTAIIIKYIAGTGNAPLPGEDLLG